MRPQIIIINRSNNCPACISKVINYLSDGRTWRKRQPRAHTPQENRIRRHLGRSVSPPKNFTLNVTENRTRAYFFRVPAAWIEQIAISEGACSLTLFECPIFCIYCEGARDIWIRVASERRISWKLFFNRQPCLHVFQRCCWKTPSRTNFLLRFYGGGSFFSRVKKQIKFDLISVCWRWPCFQINSIFQLVSF